MKEKEKEKQKEKQKEKEKEKQRRKRNKKEGSTAFLPELRAVQFSWYYLIWFFAFNNKLQA